MRTDEEIKEYLESQEWFEKYKENLIDSFKVYDRDGILTAEDFLNGKMADETFSLAFVWEKTEGGFEYWDAIEVEFIKWFKDGNKE